MKVIDKLAWIVIKDNSILLTRSYGKDKYYIPGGKRENGESDGQALSREIREELSVELKRDTLEFMGVFRAQAHGHAAGTLVQMTCYRADFTGSLKANHEIEEIKWLKYSDQDKIADVDKLIFDHLKNTGLLV